MPKTELTKEMIAKRIAFYKWLYSKDWIAMPIADK